MSASLPRPLKTGRWMRWCLYAGTYIYTHISSHRCLSAHFSPLLSKNSQSLATWLFVPPKIARQRSHVFLSPVSSQMIERLVTYLFEPKTSKISMYVFLEDVETNYLDRQFTTKTPSLSHQLFSTHLSSLWFKNWRTQSVMTVGLSCSSKLPEKPSMICLYQNPNSKRHILSKDVEVDAMRWSSLAKLGWKLPMSSLELREVRDMVYVIWKIGCRVWHEHCVPDLKSRSCPGIIGGGKEGIKTLRVAWLPDLLQHDVFSSQLQMYTEIDLFLGAYSPRSKNDERMAAWWLSCTKMSMTEFDVFLFALSQNDRATTLWKRGLQYCLMYSQSKWRGDGFMCENDGDCCTWA
jgi:hypothetical protein